MKSFILTAILVGWSAVAVATENPLVRYVSKSGAYGNDGLSWGQAKNNVQDAINELYDYMTQQGIAEGGYVMVAKGTYKPTESTNNESTSLQYLSFKIYQGINVWGGWYGDEQDIDVSSDEAIFNRVPKVSIVGHSARFVLNQYETIFDGNLDDNTQAKFVWSDEKQRYTTTFPSNVYHVVTFATNGFYDNGRARPLEAPASVNAITIKGGRAYNNDATLAHPYNAYGGGVYMVEGAVLTNSRVSECEASRNGGGIYMDGGGSADHNIITDCQALGLGIQFGMGGGAFIDQAGLLEQSYVLGNVSRVGGGLGIRYDVATAHQINEEFLSRAFFRTDTIHRYSAICKSTLIANNTTTTEAGGVYMEGGGVIDGCSVVRNRCNGVGAIINGIQTGQSAGVFANGPARVYNSVMWGGQIGANSNTTVDYETNYAQHPADSYEDLQFAAYCKNGDANKSVVSYSALNNSDLVNWSYSSTSNLLSLAVKNQFGEHDSEAARALNYTAFYHPSTSAGVLGNLKETLIKEKQTELGATATREQAVAKILEGFNPSFDRNETGIAMTWAATLTDGMFFVATYSFRPECVSVLAGAGVQLSDLPEEAGVNLDEAELTSDVLNIDYSPLCDIGCYNAMSQNLQHATTVSYIEPNANDAANTLTVFVDPERSSSINSSTIGASWDAPFKHLRDALHYVWNYKQEYAAYKAYKDSLDAHTADASKPAPTVVKTERTNFAHYQVLVKEGTIHTAATATNERISVSSIYMIDGVSVYGGYPTEFSGTNASSQSVNGVTLHRNPVVYPSIISGSYSDAGYETNVGHLVNFCSVSNVIFDGFQLRYGNATGTTTRELGSIVSFDGGGGFVFSNAYKYDGVGLAAQTAQTIGTMTGNQVRNCVVAGCTARMGAAVFTYVPAGAVVASFSNCIFHNNSVIYGSDQSVADVRDAGKEMSIVRVVNGANLTFNHCDFIRNVGVAINAKAGSVLTLKNSVFYANLDRAISSTNNFNEIQPGGDGYAKLCPPIVNDGAYSIHGQNNRFDYLFARDQTSDNSMWRFSEVDFIDNVNFDAASSNNLCNLTYNSSDTGNSDFTYPLFKNATRNAGLSTEGDITFFGGTTDWMPNAMSPLVNTGLAGVIDYDMTSFEERTYGGAPDIGAIENSVDQPENPSVMLYEKNGSFYDNDQQGHTNAYTKLNTYYVRWYDSDTKGGDGSSWNAAINGNADYDIKTGKLATVDEGTELVGEMVDSYTSNQYNEYSSSSVYRLLNKGANMYMTDGGAATSDIGLALQFVFVKTGEQATYWNGMTVPVYKFYYYVSRRHSDQLWKRSDGKQCYKKENDNNFYLLSDNSVSSGEYTYERVHVVITIDTDCPVYEKDGKEYYYYNNNLYSIDDRTHTTSIGTDLEGYTALYEECNIRHERKGVGYLQISLDSQGKFVAGNTTTIAAATEFFLVGDPNNLYVIPYPLYQLRETEGKEAYKYTGVVMADQDSDPETVTYGASVGAVVSNPLAVWAISASGSSNQYAHLGYRLKSANAVNNVPANTYISKETTTYKAGTKRNDPTYTTLKGTSSDNLRDVIHFEGAIGGDESILISTQTSNGDKGFGYEYYNNTYYYSLKPNSDYWHVTLIQDGTYSGMYTVRIPDGGHGLAYSTWQVANGESFLQLTNDENKQVYWVLEPIYTRTNTSSRINGLQYAINSANASFRSDGHVREIWVGKGTYSTAKSKETETVSGSNYQFEQNYVYKLLEGASMYGGFPTVGNPTLNERDPKKYETVLSTDAAEINEDPSAFTSDNNDRYTVGRVLYQANNFTKSTTVDGFTIQRGYLNQAMRGSISANLDHLFNNTLKQDVNVGMFGGAGALIRKGLTLENCKVTNNMAFFNSWTETKILGRTWASRTQTGTIFKVNKDNSDAGDYHVAGGGVSSLGGEIKNCEILNNSIYFFRSANSSTCAYGAGVFMTSGSISNTVIAGNQVTCNSNVSSSDQNNDIQAGAGAYLYGGAFYNNTIDGNICNHSAQLASGFSSWVMSVLGQLKINYCAYIPGVFIHNDIRMYNTVIANNTINNESFGSMTVSHKIYGYPVASLGSNWALSPGKISAYNCCVYKTGNIVYDGTTYADGAEKGEQVYYNQKNNTTLCSNNIFVDPNLTSTYRQQDSSPTVNTGTQAIKDGSGETVLVPEHDAAYETRVQDCQIDMGAYEHNSASTIVPTTVTDAGITTATYFVKSGGNYGDATSKDASNAACVEKLQRVLDAAGRYKYLNPSHVVNVYLAATENSNYYHPLRESDPSQKSNVRSWTIMVPRGVNLYGGYDPTTFAEDTRNILSHASILDGGYTTTDGETTKAYHVVTFTDRVFDKDGTPYLSTDNDKVSTGASSSLVLSSNNIAVDDSQLLSLTNHGVTDYAILHGLHIQNGNADGASSNNSATKVYTGYGGAAVVPSYGSIRNCIIQNNKALYGGGGLYLQPGATVCGALIKGNSAKYGGGVYFEEFEKVPTWTNFSTAGGLSGTVMDLAQLVYSTIVDNTATGKGGGVYFQNNARVVSSVLWNNHCGDQANVAGQTSAYSYSSSNEITFAKYPFSYSAVENNRLPGANNISVASDNTLGVRFATEGNLSKYAEDESNIDPYYRLTDFSMLCKTGSSVQSLNLAIGYKGATSVDYTNTARVSDGFDYVDIGATALQQTPTTGADITKILQRLYVCQPSDVDMEAQKAVMALSTDANYSLYSQKGSSFAYPFQSLDEALDYIRNLRKVDTSASKKVLVPNTQTAYTDTIGNVHYVYEYAKEIPFEIVVGRGFYYPSRDIYNVQGESLGNTFLLPEGVSVVGGFYSKELFDDTDHIFYGQNYKVNAPSNPSWSAVASQADDDIIVKMKANLTETSLANDVQITRAGSAGSDLIKIRKGTMAAMKSLRAHTDNNANNLIEPWEFKYQSVLSGKVINADDAINTYHVVTILADETLTGAHPKGYVYSNYSDVDIPTLGYKVGMRSKEKGAPVELNGLQISDGEAYRFSKTAANGYIWKDYYHGGGLMVDGNWCSETENNTLKSVYRHDATTNAVAYRNIPVIIDRCHFTNNVGGYGGAISTNTDLNMANTSFTSNQALSYTDEKVVYATPEGSTLDQLNPSYGVLSYVDENTVTKTKVTYPGNGGAIYSTKQLIGANCMFENNEATIGATEAEPHVFHMPRSMGSNTVQFGGAGGAVYSGSYAIVQFFNCNFVRNKANMYPCIFARYPNHYKLGVSNPNDADATKRTAEPAAAYNKVFGCVFWGNEGTNTVHPFSAKQIMASAPVMPDYDLLTKVPNTEKGAYMMMPDYVAGKTDAEYQAILDANYAQSLWFCAFEEHTHMSPHRDYDIRLCDFSYTEFVERSIRNYVQKKFFEGDTESAFLARNIALQDYNQIINSENSHINGPNFTKPSMTAGLAGYQQDADWMPKRINRLTDNGWGYIVQETHAKYPVGHELAGQDVLDGVLYKKSGSSYVGGGGFFQGLVSDQRFSEYVSMGEETYMIFDAKNVTDELTSKTTLNRISKMPTPTVPTFDNQESYAYIDIGVYEFQHQRLGRPLGDVDYIWVAPAEKPENGGAIGTSWLRPTSDIQRAIETLLSNRNGHKKYLYIVQGNYKPFYNLTPAGGSSMDYNTGFTINTENLNSVALAPERCGVDGNEEDMKLQYIKSLTILGGFSEEVQTTMKENWTVKGKETNTNGEGYVDEGTVSEANRYNLVDYYAPEAYRDPEAYPTRFYTDNADSHTLFDIVDARQWYGRASAGNCTPNLTLKGTVSPSLIPITIDGISFNNTSVTDNPSSVYNEGVKVGTAINYATIEKFNNPRFEYEVVAVGADGANAYSKVTGTEGGRYMVSKVENIIDSNLDGTKKALLIDNNNSYVRLMLDQALSVGEKIYVNYYLLAEETSSINIKLATDNGEAASIEEKDAGNTASIAKSIIVTVNSDMAGKNQIYLYGSSNANIYITGAYVQTAKHEVETVNPPTSGKPKLTISNCRFDGNGTTTGDLPTINIAPLGGNALIYNSLFDYNNGTAIVGGNLTTINNTFALNKKGIHLLSGTNKVHNSVFWRNGDLSTRTLTDNAVSTHYLTDEIEGISAGTNMTYNAIMGFGADDTHHNVSLGATNSDLANGPNFVDPTTGDFHLLPSIKLLNALKSGSGTYKDESELYYNTIKGSGYSSLTDAAKASFWNSEKDLQSKSRKIGDFMDRGAYEYQNKLLTFAFYNPNLTKSGAGDTWEHAYGFGSLQNAIDLVAVATGGSQTGYVFAKGGRDGKSTGESVIVRNGVQIVGSIAANYLVEPHKDLDDAQDANVHYASTSSIRDYASDLRMKRPGMAGPSTARTIVNDVVSNEGNLTRSTVIDGLEVNGKLNMDPGVETGDQYRHLIFRNSIVNSQPQTDAEKASNDSLVSTVYNTLVYNALFRGSRTVLNLGTTAYAVNVTSQNKIKVNSSDYDSKTATHNDHVINSISGCTPTTILNMDSNIEFQLPESDTNTNYNTGVSFTSSDIEASAESTNANHAAPLAVVNRLFKIGYDTDDDGTDDTFSYPILFDDRDLLGNPRKMNDSVDKGAFEAWRISGDVTLSCTSNIGTNGRETYSNLFFPHEGSFVYMAQNSNLILDNSLNTAAHKLAVMPGYLLMHKGASVYTQGNPFMTNKITVEKEVSKYGEVIALPFDMKYKSGVKRIAADGTASVENGSVARYNGDRRAMRDNSYIDGWDLMAEDEKIPATEGVRYEPADRPTTVDSQESASDFLTLQFTASGKNILDYIYSESGTSKVVKLTSRDVYGTTTAEDMGWNCFGSPFLVANFDTKAYNSTTNKYSMHVPHKMYQYHYPVNSSNHVTGAGRYLTVTSWAQYNVNQGTNQDVVNKNPVIILGEGVFTQTATFAATEDLVFFTPSAPQASPAPASRAVIYRHTTAGDEEEDEEIEEELGNQIEIFVLHSELHITGLQGGERIAVCSTDGRAEVVDTAESESYVTPIAPGIHIVRVEDQSVVIMNHVK